MKVLLIDTCGDALDLAMRAEDADHEVWHYVSDTNSKTAPIGRGLTNIVRDFRPYLNRVDLVVLGDNIHFLREIDAFRRENPHAIVFGPTKDVAQWELDREAGQNAFLEHDIAVPTFEIFDNFRDARVYVRKRDARLVAKPFGGDVDKSLSYCAKSPEDLDFMLAKWERTKKLKGKFIIQDFVEGTELGVGAYIGREGFLPFFEENFEHKHLMPQEIGPSTGELGTVILYTEKSKLAEEMLLPFELTLMKAGYTGCIDVNVIVDKSGVPYPLEWCTRLGYPATQIQQPLWPKDPVRWMYDLTTGHDMPNFLCNMVSVGVAVCMYPFPYDSAPLDEVLGFPVWGVTRDNVKNLHPYHLQQGSVTPWATAGQYALVVTGTAATVSAAARQAYAHLKPITISGNPLWRNDIGLKLQDMLPRLHKLGYAKDVHYG